MLVMFVAALAAGAAPPASADVPPKYEAAWTACRNEKLDFSSEGISAEFKGCEALIAAGSDVDNEIKAVAHTNRGMLMAQFSYLATARDELDTAIKLNPKLAPAYYNRGLLRERTGEADGAIADYSAAIAILPKMIEAYVNRGIIYAGAGKRDLALADFTRVIELEPGNADNYENRAHLLRDMGRGPEADADEAKAKQLAKK